MNNYEISILYFTLGAYSGVLLPKYITARLFGFRIQKIFSSTEFENPFMLLEKTISTDQLIQIIDDIKKFLSFSEQQEIEKYIQFLLTRNIISVNELSSCNMIHNYLLGKGTLK